MAKTLTYNKRMLKLIHFTFPALLFGDQAVKWEEITEMEEKQEVKKPGFPRSPPSTVGGHEDHI